MSFAVLHIGFEQQSLQIKTSSFEPVFQFWKRLSKCYQIIIKIRFLSVLNYWAIQPVGGFVYIVRER